MVIPLRVQCSKDFVCNRRQHSSRSQRASLSLGIRFEADNVIVLRGESPQSSLGRACRLQLIFICWCLGNEGKRVVKCGSAQMHTNNISWREWNPHHQSKLWLQLYGYSVSQSPTSVALRGVSRSTGDETRQPADFNRVAFLSLPPCTGAKPMGAVSARVVGGWCVVWVLFRPWETRRAILVGSRELCGR